MTDTPTSRIKTQRSSAPVAKQVRLNLVYIDLWAAVRVSALVAASISISFFLVVLLSWVLLSSVGVIGAVEGVVGDVLGEGGGSILALLSFEQVAVLGAVGALINMVALTVLGSLSAILYNVIARVTGGLTVGFTNQ